PRRSVPGGLGVPAERAHRRRQRGRDGRGGAAAGHPGGRQDGHRAEHRQERRVPRTGPRVVRVVRAGRRSPGGGCRARRARWEGRPGGRAYRPPDLPGDLPREGGDGVARRIVLMFRVDRRLLQNVDWPLLAAALFVTLLSIASMWTLAPGRGGAALAWRQLSWV